MKEQNNGSEFTIGLDLGERCHRFCALNGEGEVVEEGTLGNDRACLARLTARYRGALAVMEAGAHSPWVSLCFLLVLATAATDLLLVRWPALLHCYDSGTFT